MAYRIEFDPAAVRHLAKLDKPVQRRIIDFLEVRAAIAPRDHGAALTGGHAGLWKYRIGDYRAICLIEDDALRVLVVKIGHRREIYR